jgi:hypothetical protein
VQEVARYYPRNLEERGKALADDHLIHREEFVVQGILEADRGVPADPRDKAEDLGSDTLAAVAGPDVDTWTGAVGSSHQIVAAGLESVASDKKLAVAQSYNPPKESRDLVVAVAEVVGGAKTATVEAEVAESAGVVA